MLPGGPARGCVDPYDQYRTSRRLKVSIGNQTSPAGGSCVTRRVGAVIMLTVATASAIETTPRPRNRPNLVSVGTIVWLSSELMFFAALFAMYFTIRSVTKGDGGTWPDAHLDIP